MNTLTCVKWQEYHVCIYFSKPERRGSDASLKSTSSEKLCASLYENNANYSNDSICSNLSRSSDGMEWYPMATSDMETYRGQDVEGAFDIIVYIGEYYTMSLSVIGFLQFLINRDFSRNLNICIYFKRLNYYKIGNKIYRQVAVLKEMIVIFLTIFNGPFWILPLEVEDRGRTVCFKFEEKLLKCSYMYIFQLGMYMEFLIGSITF